MSTHPDVDCGEQKWWQATVSLAVLIVGIVTCMTVAGIVVLLAFGTDAPEGLIALGAAGMGALSTLLTTTRSITIEKG